MKRDKALDKYGGDDFPGELLMSLKCVPRKSEAEHESKAGDKSKPGDKSNPEDEEPAAGSDSSSPEKQTATSSDQIDVSIQLQVRYFLSESSCFVNKVTP